MPVNKGLKTAPYWQTSPASCSQSTLGYTEHGLHYGVTRGTWLGCSHECGWFRFKMCSLHSHQHHHHCCRGHMSVPPSCLEAAWPPLGSCFRQGGAICSQIHLWVVQTPRHSHHSLYCLSLPDGWSNQMSQPRTGAVPSPLHEWKARWLGWSPSHVLHGDYWRPMTELLSPMAVMSEGFGFNLYVAPFLNVCVLDLSQRVRSGRCQR